MNSQIQSRSRDKRRNTISVETQEVSGIKGTTATLGKKLKSNNTRFPGSRT